MIPSRVELTDDAHLQVLRPDDVTPAYVDGLNDEEVHRYLVAPRQQVQSLETVQAFVAANAADPASTLFGLFVDGTLRGTARLHDLVPGGDAYIGIALFDRSIWGQGWARRVIDAVAGVAAAAGVQVLRAGIEHGNVASQRAFAAAGFTRVDVGDDVTAAQRWARPLADIEDPRA